MPSSPLPIDEALPELLAGVERDGAAVLVAPPGAGKTTRVPPALLDAGLAGDGRVVVLQPRRVAARAAARRIAFERGARVGDEVGYRIRFEDRTGPDTRIEVVTEGLLTRRLQSDPFLEGIGCVVLDEFHERSLHADLGLALLRDVRAEARPDLRLVVMSATLEPAPVAAFLDAAVVHSEGRAFPVDIEYAAPSDRRVEERVAAAVRAELKRAHEGHLLCFLPGVGEIERTARHLGGLGAVEVHRLHGRLKGAEQDRALAPSKTRKVVLATNIAETSVTIEGVRAVIDSGLAREPRFDAAVGLERLETVRISRASADQRAGRAGRTGPGRCLRLWSQAEHRGLQASARPEIRRVDLTRTALEVRGWGADPRAFGWFEAPDPGALDRAEATLTRLGALEGGGLTAVGHELLALPVHPRLGRVVQAGHRAGCLREAATVAALASERDVLREAPETVGDSDLLLRMDALEAFERGRTPRGLDERGARQVLRVRDQLVRMAERTWGRRRDRAQAEVLRTLLAGFPDRVGLRRAPRSERFLLASGTGAALDRRSVVRDAPLIVAVTLSGGRRGQRAEHIIRVASALDPAWLDVEEALVTRFDPERQAVVQYTARRYLALELETVPAGRDADPHEVARVLAEAVARDPRRALSLSRDTEEWLARLRWLAAEMPEMGLPTFPELDPPAGDASESPRPESELLQMVCAGKRSFADLARVDLLPSLRGMAGHRACATVDQHAPARLKLPDGRHRRLSYTPGEPPVLAARIQQLFGLRETPRVAGGRVPVMLHLLAPNQRPAQITQDLESFWATTYAEVRKQLRGRYPKHDWPEDPLAFTHTDRRR